MTLFYMEEHLAQKLVYRFPMKNTPEYLKILNTLEKKKTQPKTKDKKNKERKKNIIKKKRKAIATCSLMLRYEYARAKTPLGGRT